MAEKQGIDSENWKRVKARGCPWQIKGATGVDVTLGMLNTPVKETIAFLGNSNYSESFF